MPTPLNPYEQQTIIERLRRDVGALKNWRQGISPGLAGVLRDARGPSGSGGPTPTIDALLSTVLSAAGDTLYWDGSSAQALSLGSPNEVMTVGSGAPQWTHDLREVASISSTTTPPAGNIVDFRDATINAGAALGNWWVGNFDLFPGVAHLGFYGITKGGFYSHALIQTIGGATALNAAAGQSISLTLNGGTALAVGVDVFLATAALGTFGVPIQLQNGTSVNEFSTDTTLAGNSDDAVPTERAVKTYVDGKTVLGTRSVSSSLVLSTSDEIVTCDPSSKAFALTLPAAVDHAGTRIVVVRDLSSAGNAVTVTANAADRINGAATHALTRAFETHVYWCNGNNWFYEA